MNWRFIKVIIVIASAGALAFALGRTASPPLSSVAISPTFQVTKSTTANPKPAPDSQIDIRAIADASFDETYQLINGASFETRREWVKELEKISARPKRWAALATLFRTLIQVDGVTAAKLILELESDNKWVAVMAVKDAAPPRAMRQVVELLMTYDLIEISSCSYNYLRTAIAEWSQTDPLGVKDFLETHPDSGLEQYAPVLVRSWAAYDPEAALAWAKPKTEASKAAAERENGLSLFSEELMRAWIEGFMENDRAAAIEYLLANSDSGDFDNALSSVFDNLYAISVDDARTFVERLPDEQKDKALYGLNFALVRGFSDELNDRSTSPEFVVKWMMQFSSEAWKQNIGQALNYWKDDNAPSLFAWMGQLPSDIRKIVVSAYDPYLAADTAQKEFDIVMQIADISLRDQVLERLMSVFQAHSTILPLIEKASLPPEQKVHLAGLIPKQSYEVAEASEDESEQ